MTKPDPAFRWKPIYSIVVIVLGLFLIIFVNEYFGIVDTEPPIPERCTLQDELYCEDFHVTPEGMELVVKNNGQSTIEVTEMRVKETSAITLMECEFDSFTLAPSETRAIQSSLCPTPLRGITGNKYKFDITYVYSLEGDSTEHTGTGELFAKVE